MAQDHSVVPSHNKIPEREEVVDHQQSVSDKNAFCRGRTISGTFSFKPNPEGDKGVSCCGTLHMESRAGFLVAVDLHVAGKKDAAHRFGEFDFCLDLAGEGAAVNLERDWKIQGQEATAENIQALLGPDEAERIGGSMRRGIDKIWEMIGAIWAGATRGRHFSILLR